MSAFIGGVRRDLPRKRLCNAEAVEDSYADTTHDRRTQCCRLIDKIEPSDRHTPDIGEDLQQQG